MTRGVSRLVLYWDPECTKPVGKKEAVDLGDTVLDGEKQVFIFHVKNEGNRAFYADGVACTRRPDVTASLSAKRIAPGGVAQFTVEWDTSRAESDLDFQFEIEGKCYPFGD